MKRLLLVLLIASLFFPSCRPLMEWIGEDVGNTHSATWYVKNHTDKPLLITPIVNIVDSLLIPGDSLLICNRETPKGEIPFFEILYGKWKEIEDSARRVNLLSNNGELLRTWKYMERNEPSKQFFNESYWRRYEEWDDRYTEVKLTWIFDILPEDIAPAKPEP